MFTNFLTQKPPQNKYLSFTIDEKVLPVKISRRRNVKRVIMRVREGAIHLSAPPHLADSDAMNFIAQNQQWISEQLQNEDVSLTHNGKPAILFKGEITPIVIYNNPKRSPQYVEHKNNEIIINIPPNSRLKPSYLLEKWLIDQAQVAISLALGEILSLIDYGPTAVSIRAQKTLWGSCSTTGRLSFNWRLILATPEALHYVVAHETAHLIHHNHSKQFWDEVEAIMPDYKIHQKWLKKNQASLFMDIKKAIK